MKLSAVIQGLMKRPLPGWAEGLVFVVLAFGAVSGALLQAGHVVGDGVDLYGTFWFYWWVGDSLLHFRDPSFTNLMFYPLGKDIFAHTGNNFVDALFAQPFRMIFGFPRYQPWFVWFLLVGNALSFMPLARHVCRTRAGAFTAAALWMLNPFTLFELMCGRLTQAFLWFMPLAIWQFLLIGKDLEQASWWRRWRPAVLAGLFTGLQGWTYWFGGYFLGMALTFLAGCRLVEMARDRRLDRALFLGWLQAGLACAVVVAPGVLLMSGLNGDGSVPGTGAEVGSIFEPPRQLRNNVSATLHGYILQETAGQPMLGYWVWGGGMAALAVWGRGVRRWLLLALLAIPFAIGTVFPRGAFEELYATVGPWLLADYWAPRLSLSPYTIHAEGLVMPHYMAAYKYLPFFDRLWFPYRMIVVTFLGLSLGLGGLVDRVWSLRWKAGAALGVFLVAGTALEQSQNLAYPLVHRDLEPPSVYEWIGEQEGGLVEMPVGIGRISIAWQPVHGQPTFGGMAENAELFWPEGHKERLKDNRFIRELSRLTRQPGTNWVPVLTAHGNLDRELRGLAAEPENSKNQEAVLKALEAVANRWKKTARDEADRLTGWNHHSMLTAIDSLKSDGFRWVVLDRHLVDADLHRYKYGREASEAQVLAAPFDVQNGLMIGLGPPVAVDGSLVVWDLVGGSVVPEELAPTPEKLGQRTWPMDDMPAYEAHLRSQGRMK